jgi:hypothetical protein
MFKKLFSFQKFFTTLHVSPNTVISGVKFAVWWKLLCFRIIGVGLFACGPVYALVYPVLMGHPICRVLLRNVH